MGTAGPYPYPEPSDPVAAGADAIKALANAVNTQLPTMVQAGSVTVPATGIATVTFPVAFTVAPFMSVALHTGGGANSRTVALWGVTTTKFELQVNAIAGGAVSSGTIHWIAVQP